jgi:hypothetical protein
MENCIVLKVSAEASAGQPIGLAGELGWINLMVPPYLGVEVLAGDEAVVVGAAAAVVAGLEVAWVVVGAAVTGALVVGGWAADWVVEGWVVVGVFVPQALITKAQTNRMAIGKNNFFNFSPFLEI